MSPKISESSKAESSSDVLYCKWGMISFNNLLQEYDIIPEGKSPCSVIFFKFCNFRLPITKFCKFVLDEYQIHIPEVHPLGLAKRRHFEFACLGLGHIPEILVFRVFFVLVWKSLFFTFDRRDIGVSCLRSVPSSSRDKDWRKKFFYIDAGVIPREMHWREMAPKERFKDDDPPADAYIKNALFKTLSQHPSECQVIPEGALVLRFDNGKCQFAVSKSASDVSYDMLIIWVKTCDWSLFDFVDPPRNAALRSADPMVGEQEASVLKVHIESFLLPAIIADSSAQLSSPPPSSESEASLGGAKKMFRIRITEKKSATIEATDSPVAAGVLTAPEGVVVTSTPAIVSPRTSLKRRRTMPP
ncbi:hypothetical protein Hanom_Chr00s000002g01600651 [Helianthus anomalus]